MRRTDRRVRILLTTVMLGLWLAGCAPAGGPSGAPAAGGKLNVVATTTVVADVVARVGGDHINLHTLLAVGAEPHTYAPNPANIAAVHDARVLFANGAGLEAFLDKLLQSAGGNAERVDLSNGIELQQATETPEPRAPAGTYNPHVWFSVPNVIHWVGTIKDTLSANDPANKATYEANATAYVAELESLDGWIKEQVATVPAANRKLVTNHPVFGYFAGRYGFEQLGAIYPVGPSAEPSAHDIGALEDTIRAYKVPAVFTESTVNPKLAEQVARDTGIKVLQLYTDSLGPTGSGAATYVEMMRYDVSTIVGALKG